MTAVTIMKVYADGTQSMCTLVDDLVQAALFLDEKREDMTANGHTILSSSPLHLEIYTTYKKHFRYEVRLGS